MEQLLTSALTEVANCTLGISILEMGVDAAEGKTLAAVVACLLEGIVVEAAVATVVVLDANAVLGGNGLKGLLGCDGLDNRVINLEMDELQSGIVVHKDGGILVSLLGE